MKKKINVLGLVIALITCMGLSSCTVETTVGKSSDALVGSWEAVAEYIQDEDGTWVLDKTYGSRQCIWRFTSMYLTITDSNDGDSGREMSYSLINGKLSFGSFRGGEVSGLTLNGFNLEMERSVMFDKIKVKRTFKRI